MSEPNRQHLQPPIAPFDGPERFSETPFPDLAGPWRNPPPPGDPELRGACYLAALRQLTPDSGMVELPGDDCDRTQICSWIGLHIHHINRHLQTLQMECEACLQPYQRPPVQILAAPLVAARGLDGVCNVLMRPMMILVDVGRILPVDWLGAVAHEYAHAMVGSPGHNFPFQQALIHLCLGLGLVPPPTRQIEQGLASWPPCRSTGAAREFWLGQMPLGV